MTWPEVLDLLTDNAVVAVVTVVSGVVAIVGVATGAFKKFLAGARHVWERLRARDPRRTLAFVQKKALGHAMWAHGGIADAEALQVSGDFLVTNVSDPPRPIVISDIRVVLKQAPRDTKVHNPMPLLNLRGAGATLPPRITAELRVLFFVTPRFLRPGVPLRADIALVDQFGTEFWAKGVEFESRV